MQAPREWHGVKQAEVTPGAVARRVSCPLHWIFRTEVTSIVRTLLRLLLWIAAVIVIIFAMGIWWFVYRPLPNAALVDNFTDALKSDELASMILADNPARLYEFGD